LQKLRIPVAVVVGMLGLLFRQLFGGIVDQSVVESATLGWGQLPGLFINVVFAAIFLGEHLPHPRELIKDAGPQLCYGMFVVWGQWSVGTLFTGLVLQPFWGSPDLTATILPLSFAGGHGSVVGMASVFQEADFPNGLAFGLVSATVGLLGAVILGVLLANWGMHMGLASMVVSSPTIVPIKHSVEHMGETSIAGLNSLTYHAVLVGLAVGLGAFLKLFIESVAAFTLPLFPLCMIGGIAIQFCIATSHVPVQRSLISQISSFALELIVISAMASIDTQGIDTTQAVPLLLLNVIGIAWNLACFLVFARFLVHDYWFERGIAEFGSAMGVLATGILLLRMVDPRDATPVMRAFNLKQVVFALFMGGGLADAVLVVLVLHKGVWLVFWISTLCTLGWLGLCMHVRGRHKSQIGYLS